MIKAIRPAATQASQSSQRRSRVPVLLVCLLPLFGCSTAKNAQKGPETGATNEKMPDEEIKISQLTLGPGDEIEISVWRNPDFDGKFRLDSTGKISMPLLGVLEVNGLGPFELREKLIQGLSTYLRNPQVKVSVTAFRSQKVFVLGEVQKPGIFQLDGGDATLVEAIAQSGGLTAEANAKNVFLIRGKVEMSNVSVYNLQALVKEGDATQNPTLRKGDILYVPPSTVTKVDRFFKHLATIIGPIVELERGIIFYPLVEETLKGGQPVSIIIRP